MGPPRVRSKNRRFIWATLHTLTLTAMLGSLTPGIAIAAGTNAQMSPAVGNGVQLPRVAAEVANLPDVEGGSTRFTRISTAEGLSQTRVSQLVRAARGII